MHHRITRQQRNGSGERSQQGIISSLVAPGHRWQLEFPAHANVATLTENHPSTAVHHREIVSYVYLLHTLLLTKMNWGSRLPAMKRESCFSPNFCCISVSAR